MRVVEGARSAPVIRSQPEVVAPPVAVPPASAPAVAGPLVAAPAVVQAAAATQAVTAELLANAVANAAQKKAKKPEKNKCFRCGQSGHLLADCKEEFYDFCEGSAHEGDCHLLTAPKPQLTMSGYAHEELVFFEYPCMDGYMPRWENVRLPSLTVSPSHKLFHNCKG